MRRRRLVFALAGALLAAALGPRAAAGSLACQCRTDDGFDLYLLEQDGSRKRRVTDWSGEEGHPSFSPDGKRLAFHGSRDGNFEIYVMELPAGSARRLTEAPGLDIEPVWAPDGMGIYFTSDRTGRSEIHLLDPATRKVTLVVGQPGVQTQEADPSPDATRIAFTQSGYVSWRWYVGLLDARTGATRLLTDAGHCRPSWAPGGDALYFSARRARGHALVRLDVASGAMRDVVATPGVSYYDVRVSSDGRTLAFHGHPYKSDGGASVYVMAAEGAAAPRAIAPGCMYPSWAPDR